jgi:hypothetical protein
MFQGLKKFITIKRNTDFLSRNLSKCNFYKWNLFDLFQGIVIKIQLSLDIYPCPRMVPPPNKLKAQFISYMVCKLNEESRSHKLLSLHLISWSEKRHCRIVLIICSKAKMIQWFLSLENFTFSFLWRKVVSFMDISSVLSLLCPRLIILFPEQSDFLDPVVHITEIRCWEEGWEVTRD